jgi:hypothetical protein
MHALLYIGEVFEDGGQSAQNARVRLVIGFFYDNISVHTEITDTKNASGWVLFDDECRLCRRLAWIAPRQTCQGETCQIGVDSNGLGSYASRLRGLQKNHADLNQNCEF